MLMMSPKDSKYGCNVSAALLSALPFYFRLTPNIIQLDSDDEQTLTVVEVSLEVKQLVTNWLLCDNGPTQFYPISDNYVTSQTSVDIDRAH